MTLAAALMGAVLTIGVAASASPSSELPPSSDEREKVQEPQEVCFPDESGRNGGEPICRVVFGTPGKFSH